MTDYQLLDRERCYEGRVLSLYRDTVEMSDGSHAVREVIEHPGAVAVVALYDNDDVVLVNQYRHPVRARLDELPAGLLDVACEPALECARRELAEEARLAAGDWHVLVDLYTSPGMSGEAIRIFLARELRAKDPAASFAAESEELTLSVHRVPLEQAVQRVRSGEITNGPAVAGLLAAECCRFGAWTTLRPADAPWPARPGR